ncbi:MAG: HD domain-containing protein [Clostridiales Family XIII bacterium]|nr:HD domain-containing protein [Clostridiales Family XIII bacterium]
MDKHVRINIHKSLAKVLPELISYFNETNCEVSLFTKIMAQDKPSIYILPPSSETLILKARSVSKGVPIMIVSDKYNEEEELDALSYGAQDYAVVSKLLSLVKRVTNLINSSSSRAKTEEKIEILIRDKDRTQNEISNLQEALLSTVAEIVEFRDIVTGGHVKRTSQYLEALINNIKKFGIYEEETAEWDVSLVTASSMLHDVGKIKTPDAVLLKNSKLTESEFDEIKQHTIVGADLLQTIRNNMAGENDENYLTYAITFAKYHHEKWDGSGYPEGLKGAEIPLLGRLMSIVDVYDALVSKRPYKEGMDPVKAGSIIIGDAGRAFDPLLIEVFKKTIGEFDRIRASLESEPGLVLTLEVDDTGVDGLAENPS